MTVHLDPNNIFPWRFFWTMDSCGYEFALQEYRFQLSFKDEFEHGAFFEKVNLLKRKVETLRTELIKKS